MVLPTSDVMILYDIPSTRPGIAWSGNTWKTRFALNYKGIPYRTQWVEYPDIAPLLSSFGVEPNAPSAVFRYTLPAIYDPRTHTVVMDSRKIAAHLDATYPATPAILPAPARAFEAAFEVTLRNAVHFKVMPLLMHTAMLWLNPASQGYWRTTREAIFGTLEDISPPGSEKRAKQWAELEDGFGVLASWFEAAGDGRLLMMGGGEGGEGGMVCHADTTVAGMLIWIRIILGAESEEWQRVEALNGGRWKRFLALFDKWADTSR